MGVGRKMNFYPLAIKRETFAVTSAVLGVVTVVTGLSLGIIAYDNSNTVTYSLLNHFVSELGWAKMSSGAWIFNLSIAIAGVMFIPLLWEMGRHLGTRLGWVTTAIGIGTAVTGSLIGMVPMDRIGPHVAVACFYFWGLLFMAIMFAAAIWFSPVRQQAKGPLLISFALFVLCLVFGMAPKGSLARAAINIGTFKRPDVWNLAIMEWSVVILTVFWVLTIAVYLLMRQTKTPVLNTATPDTCVTDSTKLLANAAVDKGIVNDVR